MTQPLVSIIMPFYRQDEFLQAAVGSALAQSYPNIAVIVVDDHSDGGPASEILAGLLHWTLGNHRLLASERAALSASQ